MALVLTDEGFKNLPCLKPDAKISLVGLHLHKNLHGSPFTVQTKDGHFRLPKVLLPLARRAFLSVEYYDGSGEGAVNDVLRRVAEHRVDLSAFVGSIVDEALAELQSRVVDAAHARSVDRAALVEEAIRALSR